MINIKVVRAHRSVTVFDGDPETWEVEIPEPQPKSFRFPDDSEQD